MSGVQQVLFYPVTDAAFDTGSYRQFAEGYFLTRAVTQTRYGDIVHDFVWSTRCTAPRPHGPRSPRPSRSCAMRWAPPDAPRRHVAE